MIVDTGVLVAAANSSTSTASSPSSGHAEDGGVLHLHGGATPEPERDPTDATRHHNSPTSSTNAAPYTRFGGSTELSIDQIAGLRDDQRRRDEGTGIAVEQLGAGIVTRIGVVGGCKQHTVSTISTQLRPKPSASISSA